MKKILMEPSDYIYPQPIVLVGSNVDSEPNFTTVSWAGIANENPPMISIALMHSRYTLKGIKQNMAFSINIPSTDMVKETDYCGIVSGAKVNKVEVCKFKVFYGKLKVAPLIEQNPINIECKVIHTLDLGSHLFVIGEIKNVYITENCLTNGKLDIDRIKPIVYMTGPKGQYHELGNFLAGAYSIGKDLK